MSKIYRPTYVEIHLDHIRDNFLNVQKQLKNKQVIPVVKANAYGHGSVEVVRILREVGVNFVAVSLLEEALELRNSFTDLDILVMGVTSKDNFEVLEQSNIVFTVYDENHGKDVLMSNHKLRFHVKVDTGMNRLGYKALEELSLFFNQVKSKKSLFLEGVYTHFATSDSDAEYVHYQQARFEEILHALPYVPKCIHTSNSSAVLHYEKEMPYTTHARVGILLYGLTLDKGITFLKPAMKVKTKIMHMNNLVKHEKVSYNITYEAPADEIIAVLPIGYADGLIRKNQGGMVSVNGKAYEIVGRICMDQTIIRVDESIHCGDDVIIMGDEIVSIDDVAKRLDTINYEVVCQITSRVPRIYCKKEVLT